MHNQCLEALKAVKPDDRRNNFHLMRKVRLRMSSCDWPAQDRAYFKNDIMQTDTVILAF